MIRFSKAKVKCFAGYFVKFFKDFFAFFSPKITPWISEILSMDSG